MRFYRALAAPARETVAPLLEEVLELMERGECTWMESLDYLDKVKRKLGQDKFVALLAPLLGKPNARGLAAITSHGHSQDHERREQVEARQADLERERKRRMDMFLYPLSG